MFILYLQTSLFPLGQLCATPGIFAEISPEEIAAAVTRHASGDWGDLCQEDIDENQRALKENCRLLSAYNSNNGVKFWIITEWDRSVTTVLLPSEY